MELSNTNLSLIDNNFIYHVNELSWGISICIMEKYGKAFGRVYWYNDDKNSIYLDMLSVLPNYRELSWGNKILEIFKKIGIQLNKQKAYLFVDKTKWMINWYERKGYIFYSEHDTEENHIWMVKSLID